MAKIKINKLPEGYVVRDGKVVKAFYHGGSIYMPGMGGMQIPVQTSTTRNTIGPVPRDMANLEAEKGETVLTDLNNETTADVGDIVKNVEDQVPFDNFLGVNLYHVVNEETQKKVIVSEDNIERIRFY